MPLTLVLGPANSAKAGEVLGAYSAAARRGALLVVPQRTLATPARFAQALRAWGAGDGDREPYAREVSALYLAYRRELERTGRLDGELYAWRALDALRAAPERWGATPVYLYG